MKVRLKHLFLAFMILLFLSAVSAADNNTSDNIDDYQEIDISTKDQYNDDNYISNEYTKTVKQAQEKINTTTTVDSVEGQISDTATLKATVTAADNSTINKGYVIFKVNNQTLKDSSSNQIKVEVKNSIAQLNYTIPKSWNKDNTVIEAVYSGSSPYTSSRSSLAGVNVSKRNATIQVITDKSNVIGGTNVSFTAIVTDNYRLVTGGVVIFKINGQTIKDKNGKNIQVNVTGGMATLKYTFDYGISAKDTNITAVYSNSIYERAEANVSVHIDKSRPIIKINPVTTSTNTTQINASIVEFNGQAIKFTTQVAIKINGQTFAKVQAVNGIINTTINTKFKSGIYTLTLVAGENNRYLAQSIDTVIRKQ